MSPATATVSPLRARAMPGSLRRFALEIVPVGRVEMLALPVYRNTAPSLGKPVFEKSGTPITRSENPSPFTSPDADSAWPNSVATGFDRLDRPVAVQATFALF